MDQSELDLGVEENPTPDQGQLIAYLQGQIVELRGQVSAMEHFANIVIGQRNEAQTEVAKLQTQAAMKGN